MLLPVADPDEVAPVQIMLCGTNAVDALFASSHEIRTAFITDWGRGVSDFQSTLQGERSAWLLSCGGPEAGHVQTALPQITLSHCT